MPRETDQEQNMQGAGIQQEATTEQVKREKRSFDYRDLLSSEEKAALGDQPDFKAIEDLFGSDGFKKSCALSMNMDEFKKELAELPKVKEDYHFTHIDIEQLGEEDKNAWLYAQYASEYITKNTEAARGNSEYINHLRNIIDYAAHEVKKYQAGIAESEQTSSFWFGGYINNRLFAPSGRLEIYAIELEKNK